MLTKTCALLVSAVLFTVSAQGQEKNGDIPEPLSDGRLITSPSEFISILSQLKLVAGYASNASITAPADGFKYVQCAVSYGTWILQIQAETERALSKSTVERGRVRTELEGVKMALYGMLGVRDSEKRMQDKERRRSVVRYQEEIVENLRKAAKSANDALGVLRNPKLMMEEMQGALPADETNAVDEDYCRDGSPGELGSIRARHRGKAIALLKQALARWSQIIDLHKYAHQLVARDLDQGEKPLLQYRVDGFVKDERQTAQEFQVLIAPIVHRMMKAITTMKAIDDSIASQNLVQRYAKTPIISGRRNDTEICREYNRLANDALTYNHKARETLIKGMTQH